MESTRVIPIGDDNFDAEVLSSDSPLPFLLDVSATWCGPCKAIWPIVERIAGAYAGQLRVGKLDMDDAPEAVRRLGVRGAPTLIVFRGGKEIGRHLGTTTRERLLALCGLA